MARPREFDEGNAIGKATAVFLDKGYENASLPDLLDGMGLTRGSLYKAFTDKKTLYLRVIEHYETTAVAGAVQMLTDPAQPDGRRRILSLFDGLKSAHDAGKARGCLLCTAAAGVEMHDPEIARSVTTQLERMKTGFAQALAASPEHTGWSSEDRDMLACALLAHYTGLRVLSRAALPLGVVETSLAGVAVLLGMTGMAQGAAP